MSLLKIFQGTELMNEVVLSRAVMGLGRHPQNDIVLDDRSVSRFHARVERRGDRFVVVDGGGQNGVHLNGNRVVGESELAAGDRITLGRYMAIFESAQGNGNGTHSGNDKSDITSQSLASAVDEEVIPDLEPVDRTKKAKSPVSPHSVTRKPPPSLVLLFNGMEVSRHPIPAAGLTIGRSKQADVVISLLGLSRQHAQVSRASGAVTVEDLGSQNGTWVNNQRIEGTRTLKHGDLLNFYDYAVLYLEDGETAVDYPAPPPTAHGEDKGLPQTKRSGVAVNDGFKRSPTAKSPIPVVDSGVSTHAISRPAPPQMVSQSDIEALGEGSFLGDEFDEELNEAASILEGNDVDADLSADLSADLGADLSANVDVGKIDDATAGAEGTFSGKTNNDPGRPIQADDDFAGLLSDSQERKFDEKTSSTTGSQLGRAWPRDEEIFAALSNSPDMHLITLEASLGGKPYTQMPLTQAITRVGTDPRCELSLPKSSGLSPWHMTLLHVGGEVVLYRAARAAKIQLADADIDMAMLRDGDMLNLGKVKMKIRIK